MMAPRLANLFESKLHSYQPEMMRLIISTPFGPLSRDFQHGTLGLKHARTSSDDMEIFYALVYYFSLQHFPCGISVR